MASTRTDGDVINGNLDSASDQKMSRPVFRWAFNHVIWEPTREQFLRAMKCIQPVERERVLSFVYKKDVKPALIGRLLLRKCAASTFGIDYSSVNLGRTVKGKPFLQNSISRDGMDFDLNVSHQGDFCVLASDFNKKVGVDVMKNEYTGGRTLEEYFRLMNRQFSPSEWLYIRGPGTSDRTRLFRFMRLWSLKESYVKAEGFGITIDLQTTSFHCPTPDLVINNVIKDSVLSVDGKVLEDWAFEESLLDSEHCVAVAINKKSVPGQRNTGITFSVLDFEQLLTGAMPFDNNLDDAEIWSTYVRKDNSPRG